MKNKQQRVRVDEVQPGDEIEIEFRGPDGTIKHWGVVLYFTPAPARRTLAVSVLAERRIIDMNLAVHAKVNVRRSPRSIGGAA